MIMEKQFNHIEPIQIRFNDIEGQQHVNNSVYQQFYDIGRTGYLSAISGEKYQTGGQSVIVASMNTNFLKPIMLHDRIQVETRIEKIGNKSMTMHQRIVNTETRDILSDCTTVFAGFDYEKQETIPISREMRDMIKKFEN